MGQESQDQPSSWCLLRLQHSLQALAQPSTLQLGLLPDLVVKADELALEFDNWYRCVRSYSDFIHSNQQASLDAIDRAFEQMSSQGNSKLWTEAAVHER